MKDDRMTVLAIGCDEKTIITLTEAFRTTEEIQLVRQLSSAEVIDVIIFDPSSSVPYPSTPTIPVLVLTGEHTGTDARRRAVEAGASCFLRQPFDEIELCALIKTLAKPHTVGNFPAIFENIQDAYYEACIDGTILEVSPSIHHLTNGQFTREELIGQSMNVFYPDPAERTALLSALMEKGSVTDFELTLANRDGSLVPCAISSKLTFSESGKPTRIIGTLRNITARKKAEKEVRLSQQRLTRAELITKSGNWEYNLSSCIGTASFGARAIYGIKKSTFTLADINQLRLPEYNPACEAVFKKLIADGTPYEVEYKIKTADSGEIKDIRSLAELDADGNSVFGIVQDVTEAKRADMALRQSETRNRLIFQTTLDGFWIIDDQRHFIEINDTYCRLIGYSREELMGMTVHEIAINDSNDEARERIARVVANGSERFEGRHRKKDGSILYLEISINYMSDDGNFFMFLHDITDRKRNEDKIKNLLFEKDLILKEVHHRVKNNMNTIFGLLTIQANLVADGDARTILLDSACRVQSMMLLYDKLYRAENSTAISIREYLPALINEILAIFPQRREIEIKTDIEDIPLTAAVLTPLGIVLNELITNTMKYAFSNRIKGTISVAASRKNGLLSIVYSDDGSGLPDSVSLDHSTGFGMQLISGLVRQIHGTITIDRTRGSRFIIDVEDTP